MKKYTSIQKIFNNLFVIQLLLNLCNCIHNIASNFIAGNFLDNLAISCNSLILPFNLAITSIAFIFSSASEIICGKFLGIGDRKAINKTFTHIFFMSLIVSIVFTSFVFIFPKPLVNLLGANDEIKEAAILYLKAYSIGIFSYILMPVLMSFLNIENDGKNVKISVLILAASYALFGYLFAKPLNLSYFGLGLANSISHIISLLFLIYRIIKNRKQIALIKTKLDTSLIKRIFLLGLPSGYSGILLSIRNIIMNNVLISSGGVMAISAFSICLSSITIQDAIITSTLNTTMLTTSICLGEKNKEELRQLIKHIFTFVLPLNAIFVLIQCLLSKTTASFFTGDINIINLADVAIKLYLLSTIFEMCNDCLIAIYTSFENYKFINIFNVLHNFVFHILFIFASLSLLKHYSVFGSYLFTEIACMFIYIIYSTIKNKHLPCTYYDLVVSDEDFNVTKLYLSINTYEQISSISQKVSDFCLKNNTDKKSSNLSGLCVEEMTNNIFEHGFTKKKVKDKKIDIYVIIENQNVSIRIRDNAISFNPETRSIIFNPDDPCKNVGLRIVKNIAKEFTYQNLFGLNNTIIKI